MALPGGTHGKDGSPMLWESLLTTGVALPGGTHGKDGSPMLWESLLTNWSGFARRDAW